ncbi:MAG: hypothetical protein IAI48_06025 [Candidatus Eremiobacteraeota bacterium]|nr:hypothetical protein [Candidatus Eremiobacteraeota bacterium]
MFLGTGAVLARPEVQLTVHGYVVHGTAQTPKLEEFSSAVAPRSGDTIEWKVVASNASADIARKLVTTLPVAPSTAFVAGSAAGSGDVVVTYSIDGGKTFAPRPMRVTHTAAGDVVKAADPSTYTTVRWMQATDIGPKSTATFSYEAKVK